MPEAKTSIVKSLNFRLSMPLVVLVCLTLLIIAVSRISVYSMSEQSKTVGTIDLLAIDAMLAVSSELNSAYRNERASLRVSPTSNRFNTLAMEHQASIDSAIESMTALLALDVDNSDIYSLKTIQASLRDWGNISREVFSVRHEDNRVNFLLASDMSAGKSLDQLNSVTALLEESSKNWVKKTQLQIDPVLKAVQATMDVATVAALVGILWGVLNAILLPRAIRLRRSEHHPNFQNIAQREGDSTQRIDNPKHVDQNISNPKSSSDEGTEIKKPSGNTGSINSIVDSIAFQTNFLAMHAALEASRAGEQSTGLIRAVAEIRVLAQRSAITAKETKTPSKKTSDRMNTGTLLARTTDDAFKGLFDEVV